MLKFLIKDYYGVVENGILVILTVNFDNIYYEGTFWYDKTQTVLTVDIDLENIHGKIEEDIYYNNYISDLLSIVSPYDDLIGVLPALDM